MKEQVDERASWWNSKLMNMICEIVCLTSFVSSNETPVTNGAITIAPHDNSPIQLLFLTSDEKYDSSQTFFWGWSVQRISYALTVGLS